MVKQETNNAVNAKIDFGDFDLSLIKSFPNFHFTIEDVSVIGIDEFEGKQLAAIKELNLVVDLMSVIKGETIQVKRINVIEPYIETKVLANGKANWDIAKESETVEVEDSSLEEGASSFKMDLNRVSIEKGRIIYDDVTMPIHMDIANLDIDLTGDLTASVTNIDAHGSVAAFNLTFDGVQYMKNVKVLLDVVMEMDIDQFKFTFKDNEIWANKLPLGLDGWLAMPNESIDMDLTFEAKKTDFIEILSLIPAEFAQDLEGVKTAGTLALNGYAKGSYLDSIYPAFGINMEVANAMFQFPDLPKAVEDIQIKASVESKTGDVDYTIVDVPKFHFKMADNPFDLNFYLATPISDPYIRAGMKGKLVLDNIKDLIPLDKGDELGGTIISDFSLAGNLSTIENEKYEEFKAGGSLIVEKMHYASDSLDYPVDISYAGLEFSPRFVELTQFDMLLGKSDLAVNGKLENFIGYALKDDQVLKGVLNIKSNLLDINQLAGIDPDAESPEETEEEISTEEPMEVVLLPKNIDFTTNAAIAKLIFDNIEITDIAGAIVLKQQMMRLENTGMSLLDGRMIMSGFYETTDSVKPTYDFAMDVKGFDVQKTVKTFNSIEKLAPLAKSSNGKYSSTLTITGALDQNMDPIFESMFGKGKLSTDDITVEGYKPLEKMAELIKYDKLNPLNFKDLNLTFTISEGKVYVDPFTNKIGNSKVTISGSNSFDQTIDYVFKFEIPRSEFGGAANAAVDGLLAKAAGKGIDVSMADNINVDVRMVGPATDPKITTDFKQAAGNATDALNDKAKEELEKKKKELEDKAKKELEEAKDKAQQELERKRKEAEEKAKEELEKEKKKAEEKLKEEAKKKLKGIFK
tara:strand:- start:1365 stop:3947 length:2583 start_codon:yes stop_codon:yes gene_type:complete